VTDDCEYFIYYYPVGYVCLSKKNKHRSKKAPILILLGSRRKSGTPVTGRSQEQTAEPHYGRGSGWGAFRIEEGKHLEYTIRYVCLFEKPIEVTWVPSNREPKIRDRSAWQIIRFYGRALLRTGIRAWGMLLNHHIVVLTSYVESTVSKPCS
jgi:hypothetical protein